MIAVEGLRLVLAGELDPEDFAECVFGSLIDGGPISEELLRLEYVIPDDRVIVPGVACPPGTGMSRMSPAAQLSSQALAQADWIEHVRPRLRGAAPMATIAVGELHRLAEWLSAGEHDVMPADIADIVETIRATLGRIDDEQLGG